MKRSPTGTVIKQCKLNHRILLGLSKATGSDVKYFMAAHKANTQTSYIYSQNSTHIYSQSNWLTASIEQTCECQCFHRIVYSNQKLGTKLRGHQWMNE